MTLAIRQAWISEILRNVKRNIYFILIKRFNQNVFSLINIAGRVNCLKACLYARKNLWMGNSRYRRLQGLFSS